MQRLDLDYRRSRRDFPWVVAALIIVGVVCASGGIWYYQLLEQEIATLEREVRRLEKAVHPISRKSVHEERDFGPELKRADQVIRQLALPWDQLFQAVEAASSKNVALLAIQPDAVRREVQISAEAKNFNAMLGYVERLQSGDWFAKVRLENHQVREQDPQQPVRFTLAASWGVVR
jgi:Tfp pilus assembly protein PilN